MKLRDLVKETKELKVIYKTSQGDFVINLEYRPQAVTLGFLDEMRDLENMDKLLYQIEKLVVKWDLQDDDDKVIPVTQEAVKKNEIPVYLLSSIIDSITKDRLLFAQESKKG